VAVPEAQLHLSADCGPSDSVLVDRVQPLDLAGIIIRARFAQLPLIPLRA
jgi:hypothetical protein